MTITSTEQPRRLYGRAVAALLIAAFAFLPAATAGAATSKPEPTYHPEMSDKEFAKKCKKKGGRVVKDGNQRYCVIDIELRSSGSKASTSGPTSATR